MDAWKSAWVSLSVAAACFVPTRATAGSEAGLSPAPSVNPSPVRIRDQFTARAVRGALDGASKRLEHPRCQQLFADFADAEGRSLRQNLAALGETGGSYMDKMLFYEGDSQRTCGRAFVVAFTKPGSRVVMVCGKAFRDAHRRDARMAEAVLIHEALHSLGLGENPPSSQAITARVLKQCRK